MSYTKTNWQDLPNTTTPINATNLNKMENGIADANGAIGASNYDSTATYAVNDICIYNNKLYKCKTAISTAEAWNSSHWEEIKLLNSLSQIDILFEANNFTTTSGNIGLDYHTYKFIEVIIMNNDKHISSFKTPTSMLETTRNIISSNLNGNSGGYNANALWLYLTPYRFNLEPSGYWWIDRSFSVDIHATGTMSSEQTLKGVSTEGPKHGCIAILGYK